MKNCRIKSDDQVKIVPIIFNRMVFVTFAYTFFIIVTLLSIFMKRKKLEMAGIQAVKNLRRNKLTLGFPFMINSDLLPPDQCYLEYPDGSIKLVELNPDNSDYRIIAELTEEEGRLIRKKYQLI